MLNFETDKLFDILVCKYPIVKCDALMMIVIKKFIINANVH